MPTLLQQGVRVFILSDDSDSKGMEGLSGKIQQASDQPLSPELQANATLKGPAMYIYTSGTTGTWLRWCLPAGCRLLLCCCDLRFPPRVLRTSSCLAGLPKAALVTHERVMQAALMFSLSNVREDDVLYLYLPLYHTSGFLLGLCGAMETGKGSRWTL